MRGFPTVSVVISTYDRPEFLDRALASVAAQTYGDFEVVVVDDCSPDKGAVHAVLERNDTILEGRGVELKSFRLGENSGYQCLPKNIGIEWADADYIAYLDDDNEWLPDHLETLVAAIEADFSTDMVYSRLRYVIDDEESRAILNRDMPDLKEGDAPGQPWNPLLLLERNYIDTSTILHSKGAFWALQRELGYGWDVIKRRKGDHNFVARWAAVGLTAKLVDKVTAVYHWHKGCLQLTRPELESPVALSYFDYMRWRRDAGNPAALLPGQAL